MFLSFVGKPFKHDLFVTYSHGDVVGNGQNRWKNWAEGFCEELEAELNIEEAIEGRVRVFRDEDPRDENSLERHGPLKENLEEKIRNSALLMVMMSRQYLASEKWCARELKCWLEHAEELRIPHDSRYLIAKLNKTTSAWPDLFRDSEGNNHIGINFIDPNDDNRPNGWPRPNINTDGEFRDTLIKLAGDVRRKLISLKSDLEEKRRADEDRQRLSDISEIKSIYLHARKEHEPIWNQVSKMLQERGFLMSALAPDTPHGDAKSQERAKRERVEGMRKSDALLLLGSDNARSLNEDLTSIGRFDRMEARDQSNRLLPCAVLDTANIGENFQVVRRNARQLNIHWLLASVADPPDLHSWLSEAAS